jgi:hypothetical protein
MVRVLYGKSGGGYAFPSGHSQSAVVFWGACAWELKRAWGWVAAVILMALIGISRLYLGVHWPIDVLGGWTIGAVILGLYILYDAKVAYKKAFTKTIPLIVIILALGVILFFINQADTSVRVVGVLVGLAIGYILEEKYINFEPRSVWWYQILKVVVGLVVAFAIKIGVKMVLPDLPVSDTIRYAIMGFWIAFLLPCIFRGRKR